jgi:hypothetical protein
MNPDPITEILLAILALIFGIAMWILLYRYSMVLIVLSLAAFITRVVFNQEIIIFKINQYNIFIFDILSLYLLSISIVRLINPKIRHSQTVFGIIFLGILLFLSWFRGTLIFGLELSTNELRIYLYFFAVIFYTITHSYTPVLSNKFATYLGLSSVLLIVIAFIRWTLIASGLINNANWIGPDGRMIRVISAAATFLLLQTQIYIFYFRSKLSWKPLIFFFALLVTILIIILQHRTVWAALLVAISLATGFKAKQSIWIILCVLFSIAIMVLLFINSDFSLINLSGTSLDLGSFSWRILGWEALLAPDNFHTTLDYFIGQPFGTGYTRYLTSTNYATTVSPHNFYVQTFLNIGGVGLFIILAYYGWLLKSLWNQRNNQVSRGFFILLSTQLIYYITYSPSYEQGFILGLAVIFVHWKKREISTKKVNGSVS